MFECVRPSPMVRLTAFTAPVRQACVTVNLTVRGAVIGLGTVQVMVPKRKCDASAAAPKSTVASAKVIAMTRRKLVLIFLDSS